MVAKRGSSSSFTLPPTYPHKLHHEQRLSLSYDFDPVKTQTPLKIVIFELVDQLFY